MNIKLPYTLYNVSSATCNKYVLINGPANTGKDELYRVLGKHLDAKKLECKNDLHNLTMKLFLVEPEVYWDHYEDRDLKEVPTPLYKISVDKGLELERTVPGLKGKIVTNTNVMEHDVLLSPRQALIYVSEVVVKPNFGLDWFGRSRVELSRSNTTPSVFVDASAAFVEEIYPLIEEAGQENILLVRVHRTGFDFKGDSRGYLPDDLLNNTVELCGDGGLEDYLQRGLFLVNNWLITGEAV